MPGQPLDNLVPGNSPGNNIGLYFRFFFNQYGPAEMTVGAAMAPFIHNVVVVAQGIDTDIPPRCRMTNWRGYG
jgi:hypothetical protein